MKEKIINLIQFMESAVAETLSPSIHDHLTNGLVTLDTELEMMDYDEMALTEYMENTKIITEVIDRDYVREKEILELCISALSEICDDLMRVNEMIDELEDNLIT